MDDVWRRAVKNHFGPSLCKKWAQLKMDVLSIIHGMKPSLLVDYLPPNAHKLQHSLEDVLAHASGCCSAHAPLAVNMRDLCIVKIEQDILLVSLGYLHLCAKNYSPKSTSISLLHNHADGGPVYIDITKGLPTPCIASAEKSAVAGHHHLAWCRGVSQKLELGSAESETVCAPAAEHPIPIVEAPVLESDDQLPPSCQTQINLCTLFGQLVGYPTVYWFDVEKGYSLDTVNLVRHSLIFQPQQPSDLECSASEEWFSATSQASHQVNLDIIFISIIGGVCGIW